METNALRADRSVSYGAIQGEQNVQSESLPRRVWNAVKDFFALLFSCIPTSQPDVSSHSFAQRVQTAPPQKPEAPEEAQSSPNVNKVQEQKIEEVQQPRPPIFPLEHGHLDRLQTRVDTLQKQLDAVNMELQKSKPGPTTYEMFKMLENNEDIIPGISAGANRDRLLAEKKELELALANAQRSVEGFKPILLDLVEQQLSEVGKILTPMKGSTLTKEDLQAMGLGESSTRLEVRQFLSDCAQLQEDLTELRSNLVEQK